MPVFDSGFTRRGGLVRPASKSCRFSHHPLRVPRAWHRDFAACGQRSGLLALNLASIFEKLLDQKTFCFCAPHRWPNLFFILQIPCTFGRHSIVSCETMLLENKLRTVRQNRFALCLCAVRRWLCCPNWLWIFLRLLFSGNFFASWMANSICSLLLNCNNT